jgi:hypothetical protein
MLTRRDALKHSVISLGFLGLPPNLFRGDRLLCEAKGNWMDGLAVSGWSAQKVLWSNGLGVGRAITRDVIMSPCSGKADVFCAVSEILSKLPTSAVVKIIPGYSDEMIIILIRDGNSRARITLCESVATKEDYYIEIEDKSISYVLKKSKIPHQHLEADRDAALLLIEYMPMISPYVGTQAARRTVDFVFDMLAVRANPAALRSCRAERINFANSCDLVSAIEKVMSPQLRHSLFICSPTYANVVMTRG